ncbi:prepilin-type N-terminal cleavage/methylation domain-containing protein [Patescibacteria group bacterium]|nr:prepilin-type N-terminal cleavage/methylation domain-containing protein [Patescibacteria group bacterium]
MLSKRILKNNKGQSLIELVVAISIILIGVVSTLVLTMATIRGGKASEMQTIASNLAREGIEAVKQHRYNNWLRIESNDLSFIDWDDGLYAIDNLSNIARADFDPATSPNWKINFPADSSTPNICISNDNCLLYFQNGIYSHVLSGVPSPFYRVITINPICMESGIEIIRTDSAKCKTTDGEEKIGLQVISDVRWRIRNSWNSVVFEDHLYNWK